MILAMLIPIFIILYPALKEAKIGFHNKDCRIIYILSAAILAYSYIIVSIIPELYFELPLKCYFYGLLVIAPFIVSLLVIIVKVHRLDKYICSEVKNCKEQKQD